MKKKISKKKQTFGKRLMVAMVLICLQIIIYSEIAMIYLSDLSALYALIGIVAGLAVSIWAYCEKTAKENTKGGITYDLAMIEKTAPPETEDGDTEEVNEL